MDERLAHGIDLTIAAIHGDGADDDQPHVLFFDGIYDFTQLLCAAAQAADLTADEGVALFGTFQQQVQRLLCLGVAVFALGDDFFRASGLQLSALAVQVLPSLFGETASRVTINLGYGVLLPVNKKVLRGKSFRLPFSFTDFEGLGW